MTKKTTQLFWHWVSDGRIILWFNIGPSSFSHGYSCCGWAGRNTSLWFCFSLWSARKSKYIRFQRTIFELHLRGFLLVVVVLLVAQVFDQLFQAMRNSDPRVRIVLVYGLNSNFHSIFSPSVAGCDFQYGPNCGVPSDPTLRFRCIFVSWQKCTRDRPLDLWIVRIIQCLLSRSTVRPQLLSRILHQHKF